MHTIDWLRSWTDYMDYMYVDMGVDIQSQQSNTLPSLSIDLQLELDTQKATPIHTFTLQDRGELEFTSTLDLSYMLDCLTNKLQWG